MLEVVVAKSGDPTLKWDGKFLASSVDPRSEGIRWATKNCAQFFGLKSAIVVGAGAGYHLIELKRQCPHLEVIGIETNESIAAYHKKSLELLRFGISVHHAGDDAGLSVAAIRNALRGSYRVCLHPSARIVASDPKDPVALQNYLNGRSTEGLKDLIELRQWSTFVRPETQGSSVPHFLQLQFQLGANESPEQESLDQARRVLRELIR